jgi:DNA-binding MarR family transcriptional regulator
MIICRASHGAAGMLKAGGVSADRVDGLFEVPEVTPMQDSQDGSALAVSEKADMMNEFLGSSQIFALAIGQVIEAELWREAADNKLAVSQLKVLKLINLPGGHTISEVAAFLGVSKAAASKAVDKLVRRTLLHRSEGEKDRRVIFLSLTEAGRCLLETYNHATRKRLAEVFGQFSREELKQVVSLLDRLSTQIVNHSARPEELCVQCGIHHRQTCLLRQRLGRMCLYLRQRERSGSSPDMPGDSVAG